MTVGCCTLESLKCCKCVLYFNSTFYAKLLTNKDISFNSCFALVSKKTRMFVLDGHYIHVVGTPKAIYTHFVH